MRGAFGVCPGHELVKRTATDTSIWFQAGSGAEEEGKQSTRNALFARAIVEEMKPTVKTAALMCPDMQLSI